jgi:hypothetical protein
VGSKEEPGLLQRSWHGICHVMRATGHSVWLGFEQMGWSYYPVGKSPAQLEAEERAERKFREQSERAWKDGLSLKIPLSDDWEHPREKKEADGEDR